LAKSYPTARILASWTPSSSISKLPPPAVWFRKVGSKGFRNRAFLRKDDLWLSVVLERGCVLIGERDLVKS